MHDAAHWEKIPILEPRAIGYRTGPKIDDFFPMAVERHQHHRKEALLVHFFCPVYRPDRRNVRAEPDSFTLGIDSIIVSDGSLFCPENREGPWARDPPRPPPGGGVLHRRP